MEQATYHVTTDKSVQQAATDVEAALGRRRFGVLWGFDVGAKLAERGLELQGDFRILEVCSPALAKAALETNPLVAHFLPCKVVVSRRDGQTEIGLPRPTALLALLGDDSLTALGAQVEQALIEAVDEARR